MASISLEFYPPKTDEQRRQLDRAAGRFKVLAPEYVSVTFGAGGSTLEYTADTVAHLHRQHGFEAAPHLSCVGGTRAQVAALLDRYHALGCKRIVALRGDLPSGMAVSGDFRYANELVAFIREHCGDLLRIEVACYPETHPQAADAIAHEESRLLKLPKDDLRDLMFVDRELAYELLWRFVRTLSGRLRDSNDRLLMLTVSSKFSVVSSTVAMVFPS